VAQTNKTRARNAARRETLRTMLLGYALHLGAVETGTRRLLAARLWRLLPREVAPTEAIARLDRHVALWAGAALGQPVTVSQLATAILHSGLSPAFVLQPFEMIGEEVLQTLTSALVPVTPPDTPVFMPVQSLAPFYALRSASLSTSAAAHA
jgi:hypothetical protein